MRQYAGYLVRILIVIGIIILLIVGFNFIRNLFERSPENTRPQQGYDLKQAAENGHPVRYTTHGAIIGQEEHRKIRITVSPESRLVEIIQGYDGDVIRSEQFANTREAYDAFLDALRGAGFTRVAEGEVRIEEDLTCPLGRRFNYEVAPGSSQSFYSWSNSCRATQGTFRGDSSIIRSLFQQQIPEYRDFATGVRLG